MSEWQDFSSAQKDGKRFLALSKYDVVFTCKWDLDLDVFICVGPNGQSHYGAMEDVKGWTPYLQSLPHFAVTDATAIISNAIGNNPSIGDAVEAAYADLDRHGVGVLCHKIDDDGNLKTEHVQFANMYKVDTDE